MAEKDPWNARAPSGDSRYTNYVNTPELASLLPALYPGVFPNLAAYKKPRADLDAILMTGIPSGVVAGFQNYTGADQADMLRLNVAVPPSKKPNDLGLVAGDAAGFPNGRRLNDDVVTIELRAIAGSDDPAGRPVLHPGRRRQRRHGRDEQHQRGRHRQVPLPRSAGRGVPDRAGYHGVVSPPAAAVENPHAGQGAVLLDIGGDIGAVVVTMPATMDGSRWRSGRSVPTPTPSPRVVTRTTPTSPSYDDPWPVGRSRRWCTPSWTRAPTSSTSRGRPASTWSPTCEGARSPRRPGRSDQGALRPGTRRPTACGSPARSRATRVPGLWPPATLVA